MADSKFDIMALRDLQYQLDIVEENVQHLLAVQKKAARKGKSPAGNPAELCAYYEKHYRTARNLSNQYERKINLLEKLNRKQQHLELNKGQRHGIKLGLAFGLFIGFACCAPVIFVLRG